MNQKKHSNYVVGSRIAVLLFYVVTFQ
jgi:hypothetical protein